jgi:hypothetical protein
VKPAKKNFAIAYLILVIIPVLGLAGVLRSGRKLVAPAAIAGRWKMQVNAPVLAALPCAGSVATLRDVGFTISQSGRYFTLSFANSVMPSTSGFVEGATIQVSILPPAEGVKEVGCSGGHVFSMIATLDSKANPNSMAGLLSVKDCAACSPAEFRAVREK